jgi:DNA-binding NtrC family response regulator
MSEETERQPLAATLGSETILLVEDEEVVRLMLAEALTRQGYAVLDAGRGAAALALVEKAAKPIDLLVADMSMPGITGWDLAQTLRRRRPGIPVLLMSGYDDHETACWGRMDPPAKHLYKPFSLETFLDVTRQMLDLEKKSAAKKPLEKPGAAGAPGLP